MKDIKLLKVMERQDSDVLVADSSLRPALLPWPPEPSDCEAANNAATVINPERISDDRADASSSAGSLPSVSTLTSETPSPSGPSSHSLEVCGSMPVTMDKADNIYAFSTYILRI